MSVMQAMLVNKLETSAPSVIVDDADDDSSCGNHSEEGGLNFSDSDPKDSGVDCGGSDLNSELPDEETASSIMKMVEFYLSDENILKDPFLLKHVRRNKEGYVSVKLLSSFRKVRSLCKSWKAVSHSVQKSKLLSLNSEGTKVRRITPLPDHDETVTSRSIIVHNFNSDKLSVDSISELFADCGDIALVRILRPGGSIPSDIKRFLAKTPDIQSKICALVEFEEHSSAKKALDTERTDGIQTIPVVLKERNKPSSPKKDVTTTTKSDVPPTDQKESPKKKKKNRKGSNMERKSIDSVKTLLVNEKKTRRSSSGSMSSQSSGYLSSSPSSSGSYLDSRNPRRHSFNPSIYNDPNSSFASLNNRYNGSRERLQRTGTEGSSTLSPWRRRREQQLMQSDSNLAANSSITSQSLPVKTIRTPRGPDGTKGFLPSARCRLPSTAE